MDQKIILNYEDIKKLIINGQDWISKLDLPELVALANLCLVLIYFFKAWTVVALFFGDYLISKLYLEIKYPKLAIFINLIKKFKKNIIYILVEDEWYWLCYFN